MNPSALTARIQQLLDGPLARFAAPVAGTPTARPLGVYADDKTLETSIKRWAAREGHIDRRVQATQWNKHFWRVLLPPWLIAAALGGRLDLDRSVLLSCNGGPVRLRFSADPAESIAHPVHAFAPWVQSTARVGRLSARVLWNNAGNLLDAAFAYLPDLLPAQAPQLAALRTAWLDTRRLDGRRNPLWCPVTREPGPPARRVRRLCCIRYLDGKLGYCATCPLPGNTAPGG